MIKAAALEYDEATVARWSGRSVRTVRRWVGRFLCDGVDALQDAARPSRPAKADATYRAALEQVATNKLTEVRLPFDVWTADRLSAYLAETTGIRIAPSWLRSLLNRQDFVTGRPKHALNHFQDAEAIGAFEQALAAAGEKGRRRPPTASRCITKMNIMWRRIRI